MVEQNPSSGNYFQIVYSPMGSKFAVMKGQTIQQAFVPLPGGTTAEYLSWGLSHYRHPDWLGSSRLESGTARNIIQDVAYAPFGEPYAQNTGGNGELSFTGQNKDTDWLNYDFMYREYDPRQGRWISPDPSGLEAVDHSNPQSWNRYEYLSNDPLNATDPNGLVGCNADACVNAPLPDDIIIEAPFWWNLNNAVPQLPTDESWALRLGAAYGRFRRRLDQAIGRFLCAPTCDIALNAGDPMFNRPGLVRVGRWMSPKELEKMRESGRVQESLNNGVTSVTRPADPSVYRNAPPGDVYVEFDVPVGAVYSGGEGVGKIFGPNSSPFGEYYGISEMPPATNIEVIPVP
jgi:RHS repeat-associated protein